MADVITGDYRIAGALSAGNFAQGVVTITTVADTPTSESVTGLSLAGTGSVHGWATPNTTLPGDRVVETSVANLSSSGMDVFIYRTTVFDTPVRWMMARKAS